MKLFNGEKLCIEDWTIIVSSIVSLVTWLRLNSEFNKIEHSSKKVKLKEKKKK